MKYVFLILLFSLFVQAKPDLPIENLHCKSQLLEMLAPLGVSADWRKLISTNSSIRRFAAPTITFGKWAYLEQNLASKTIVFAGQSQFEVLTMELDDRCEKKNQLQNYRGQKRRL